MKIFSDRSFVDYKESQISRCQHAITAYWIVRGPSTQTTLSSRRVHFLYFRGLNVTFWSPLG